MFAELFVLGLLHAQEPGIQRRKPARMYTLQNDGTTAEDLMVSAVDRFYWFQWPEWRQKVRLPAWWRPDFPLVKPAITPRVTKKYGTVYWDETNAEAPERFPARPPRNDRAPGEMDRFGTILH